MAGHENDRVGRRVEPGDEAGRQAAGSQQRTPPLSLPVSLSPSSPVSLSLSLSLPHPHPSIGRHGLHSVLGLVPAPKDGHGILAVLPPPHVFMPLPYAHLEEEDEWRWEENQGSGVVDCPVHAFPRPCKMNRQWQAG